MNAENLVTLSKELEAGQIMDAAAELRESARRVLEQEATAQDRANLLEAYGIEPPAGATRKDALFAISDKLAESAQDQTGDNTQEQTAERQRQGFPTFRAHFDEPEGRRR